MILELFFNLVNLVGFVKSRSAFLFRLIH